MSIAARVVLSCLLGDHVCHGQGPCGGTPSLTGLHPLSLPVAPQLSGNYNLAVLGRNLLFAASDASNKIELWEMTLPPSSSSIEATARRPGRSA